jgi:O-antigen ligase
MYPHNVVLESLVIFGLPLTAMFIFLIFRGSIIYYRRIGECDLFLLFTFYAVGVSLKSGSFFGSWLALAGCLYVASYSFIGRTDRAGAVRSIQAAAAPHD